MPSVLDQPTTLPHSRPMCATIREVVVLPLVPVTATTGTRGSRVVGPSPGSLEATVCGRDRDGGREPVGLTPSSPGTSASSTEATARPIARARSRCAHG